MKLLSFPHDAYLVTYDNHILYSGTPTASPITLTGSAPSTAFRCRVKITSVTGHTDCVGSITIGSETIDFTAAGTKTTTVSISALPTVTYSGLDCHILIEAISTGGQVIRDETETAIKIRFEPTSKAFQDAQGAWTQSQAYAMVVNNTITHDDIIRYNSVDYKVKQIEAFNWLDGTEIYRILYF